MFLNTNKFKILREADEENKTQDEPLEMLIASSLNHWARRSEQEPLLARLMKRSPNLNTSMSFSISNQLNLNCKERRNK